MKLVPALGAASKNAREAQGVSAEEISVALKEAGASTSSKDKVLYFEQGRPYAALDQTVNAYAKTLGISVFDLWEDAIQRARDESRKLKRDLGGDDDNGSRPSRPKPKKPSSPAQSIRDAAEKTVPRKRRQRP